MNNEIFDTRIREKFEGAEPVFQEQDWQNFAPLLHPKIPFWVRARKPLTYAVAASAILFLTYQNYQQSIENKQLQADIQALTIEKQTANTTIERHIDTVYISKEPKLSPNSTMTKLGENNAVANTPIAQHQTFLPKAKNEMKEAFLLKNKEKNVLQNIDNQLVENKKENNISTFASAKNDMKSEANATVSNDAVAKNELKNELKNEAVAPVSNSAVAQINQEESKRETIFVAPLENDFLPKKVESKEFVLVSKPEREWSFLTPQLTKPKGNLSHFALGASLTNQNPFDGGGIVAAYTFGKHLELSAGIELNGGRNERFKDNDDFKKRHKVDFRDKFKQPLPPDVKFTNIHAAQRKVELPILLSYKIPLYRRFVGLVGVGTNLQLYNVQNFDYQYSESGNALKSSTLPLPQNKAIFQNLTFSAGIQTDWKRFTLRVSPFYVMDFDNNIPDHEKTKNGGLKTQVFYRF
jgi:hypothetical protein